MQLQQTEELYSVYHQHFCTDHYEMRPTIVKAASKEEAMTKLNDYLATNPDGGYTAKPCLSIGDVYPLTYLG